MYPKWNTSSMSLRHFMIRNWKGKCKQKQGKALLEVTIPILQTSWCWQWQQFTHYPLGQHLWCFSEFCSNFSACSAAPETPNSFWYQQKRVSVLCALQKSTKHWVITWMALFLYLKVLLKKESLKTEGNKYPIQAEISCLFLHCVTFS